jgi:hypothetical protein
MATKENGVLCQMREQIIDDPVTGLVIQFEAVPGGEFRLRLYGEMLPHGNREYQFDADGNEVGAGTQVGVFCRPAWLTKID